MTSSGEALAGTVSGSPTAIEMGVCERLKFLVLLTKADKLPKSRRKPAAVAVQRALALPRPPILVSALEGFGVDEVWRAILRCEQPASGPEQA